MSDFAEHREQAEELMKHKRYEHPKLQAAYEETVAQWKRFFREETTKKREALDLLAATVPLIEPLFPDFFVSGLIFCRINGGTKADFSCAVEQVAKVLGEPPNISVNPGEYCADFPDHKVQVYLNGATDCKLIEVEEVVTKTVKKPHPECLAALQALENIA